MVPFMTTSMRLRGSAMTMTFLTGRSRNMASVMLFALGGTLMSTQLTLF